MRTILLPLLALLIGWGTFAGASTILVRPDGTGAYPTIQAALNAAVTGDAVELTSGTFRGPGNRDITLGGKSITIRSVSGDPADCIIDCQQAGRAFHLLWTLTATTFQGITMTGGRADYYACIEDDSDGPAYIDCVFADNASVDAGGAVTGGNGASFQRCRFLRNSTGGAGGAYLAGELGSFQFHQLFEDCEFIGNRASLGAAVYLETLYLKSMPAVATFRRCLFAGNEAVSGGGAVYVEEHSPLFDHCTFVGNGAGGGGIIDCSYGAYYPSDPVLTNCLIAFSTSGSAVACTPGCQPVLGCTDLFGNSGGNWTGCVADQAGLRGNIEADPLFCDLAGQNYQLRETSPCAPAQQPDCGLIGALPAGCTGPVPVLQMSWGRIKALYK